MLEATKRFVRALSVRRLPALASTRFMRCALLVPIATAGCTSILGVDDDYYLKDASPGAGASASGTGGGLGDRLVAYWRFDEGGGSTANDASGNDNAATLNNATWSADGKVGDALAFDGTTSYLAAPSSPSFNGIKTAVTVNAWVYRTDQDSTFNGIVSRRFGPDAGDLWTLLYDRSIDEYVFSATAPSGTASAAAPASSEDVFHWVQLTGVYDGSALALYRNGGSIVEVPLAGALADETSPVLIGASDNGSLGIAEHFHGLIDEVRVYDRALSPAEIVALSGAAGP